MRPVVEDCVSSGSTLSGMRVMEPLIVAREV